MIFEVDEGFGGTWRRGPEEGVIVGEEGEEDTKEEGCCWVGVSLPDGVTCYEKNNVEGLGVRQRIKKVAKAEWPWVP